MADTIADRMHDSDSSILVVRRLLNAEVERVFDAWTDPEQVMKWWGPTGVVCTSAEIDLRVGGSYRIANLRPDGTTLWISGEFEEITPPSLLRYSWRVDELPDSVQRVSVSFQPVGDQTEVTILHEYIPVPAREMHEQGWVGCLDGLEEYVQG